MLESKYLIKPYHVGFKNAKSLAIVIPFELKRGANIDLSSIFLLKVNKKTKIMTLQNIKQLIETPADQSDLKQQKPQS